MLSIDIKKGRVEIEGQGNAILCEYTKLTESLIETGIPQDLLEIAFNLGTKSNEEEQQEYMRKVIGKKIENMCDELDGVDEDDKDELSDVLFKILQKKGRR